MIEPLTLVETPFAEKFGTPRQPLLVEEARGVMRFPKNDFYIEAFRGIENYSHLWLVFEFHLIPEESVKALVRPPRFEGKEKWGVFATRSPHRPNRLGLSVVKFDRLEITHHSVDLWVKGVDLVNGTPIFDVKPYLPYVDCVVKAKASFSEPPSLPVRWAILPPTEKELIEKVIGLDPRPRHEVGKQDEYGVSIAGWNVKFRLKNKEFEIFDCEKL